MVAMRCTSAFEAESRLATARAGDVVASYGQLDDDLSPMTFHWYLMLFTGQAYSIGLAI